MSLQQKNANFIIDHEKLTIALEGDWRITHLEKVQQKIAACQPLSITSVTMNGQSIQNLDSAGALALMHFIEKLEQWQLQVSLDQFKESHLTFFNLIKNQKSKLHVAPAPLEKKSIFYAIGEEALYKLNQAKGLFALIGDLSIRGLNACISIKRFHVISIIANLYHAGIKALPIVGMLSFLIGIVLAYQMGLQLQTYGANTFIAYLSGMAIFREFAPLITAIIVAGRTSSAFTAQIGSMKINEEIDALNTMGLSPTEFLVLPKVVGLLLVFPLLIFWSDIFSVLGAMYMSYIMLDIHYLEYLSRLKDAVGLQQFMLGMYKAPVFALIIALVGCFQGFSVSASADNIGLQTTKSVVQALFLIIVADAAFSILYSWLDL